MVYSVSWSPDGTRLATGSEDGTAKVWDAADGRERLTLRGHVGRVYSVSWSPDGTRLATGSEDGTAKVWDAAGGRERLTLRGHAGSGLLRVLVAGRDAAGDGESMMARRRCGTRPTAANGSPSGGMRAGSVAVSWSPDGTRLATGSEDGTAKVWDAAGGRELLTLKGHTRLGRLPCRGRRTGRGWRRGVRMGRRRCGTWPTAANGSPSRGMRARSVRVLVAGRDAAGDGE